jgi:hypothetical protein
MTDNLEQLLRDADAGATAPVLTPGDLSHRVRRTARNQRRAAAVGLAIVALLACTPLLLLQKHPSQLASKTPEPRATPNIDDLIHERTAAILEAFPRRARQLPQATDAYLAELQFQRDRAALVLLRDAKRSIRAGDPVAASELQRTIDLFPETPAAASASRELKQLDSSRSQI